ncbi:uncharacterized protein JCM6883_001115 [Sporobolomyces salmoneus]|uniref:uncharacterized protein n=1 Tax=Sporobolomyces salmoneus TaxID=183962 RepID=UPI003180C989
MKLRINLALNLLVSLRIATAQTNPANTTEPLVCTPTDCLQGHNSLAAGIVVTTPFNSSTEQITLLPGTYTSNTFSSSSALLANTSFSNASFSPFSKQSTVSSSSPGFTTSGSLTSSSTFSVSVLPGLTAYSAPYYEGTPILHPPTNSSNSTSSSNSTQFSSLLLTSPSDSSPLYAVVSVGSQKLVVWESIPDLGALGVSFSTSGNLVELVNNGCTGGCSNTGGTCSTNGTCMCQSGWTGSSCSECLPGHFGPECQNCPVGCKECDDGLTGTGICLDSIASNSLILPSSCNCINGICEGNSTSSNCECNAGWTKASNGTQCAACSPGYYLASSGDCLACDPSCSECSSPSGTCQTCQSGLQPLSSSSTACTTATTALSNGTFITCPSRTFFSSSSNDCVSCNSMCETCYKEGSDGCLECREPNVLLEGVCVAMDEKTGVCDGRSSRLTNGAKGAAGWVYDNQKKVCDALPAQCSKGGISSFSTSSTREDLTCSSCVPGSFLVDGDCSDECPVGTTASKDGTTCEACDSTCSTCAPSLTSYCTSCDSSHLLLNGTCISSSTCPTGYFLSPSYTSPLFVSTSNSTTSACLPCHPDCETCSSTDPTVCLTCPSSSSRPVLNAQGKCVGACSRDEYWDSGKQKCIDCSSDCETCYGSGKDECLSCRGNSLRVKGGKCVERDDCTVVEGFGVCLKELVTVEARAQTEEKEEGKRKLPWWLILVIVLVVLLAIGGGVWWFRKREQKRRREHTKKFANDLGKNEVDKKLAALPYSVAYPPLPRSYSSSSPPSPLVLDKSPRSDLPLATQEVPLTPRFVLEDPSSPISPSPSSSFGSASHRPPHRQQASLNAPQPNRWSASSYGSKTSNAKSPKPLKPEETGGSFYSQRTFTTAAGNTLVVSSKNPFFRKAS